MARKRGEEYLQQSVVKRFVIVACVGIAVTLLALTIGTDGSFRANRPRQPQPEQRRVEATVLSKGIQVYLTSNEQKFYKALLPSGTVLLITAVLLNFWWRQFPRQQGPNK